MLNSSEATRVCCREKRDYRKNKTQMKKLLFAASLIFTGFTLLAQSGNSVRGWWYPVFMNYPKTNEKISFSLPSPFLDFKDSVPDKKSTYQYLINIPQIGDSLLSEYVKYAMLSLSFESKYNNPKKGTEIWCGLINNNLDILYAVTGIYFKDFADSTKVYILTTFNLSVSQRKPKSNTSAYIGNTLKEISNKHRTKNNYPQFK
jgi:hypothetical protein